MSYMRDLYGAPLDEQVAGFRPNTVALLGDSITDMNGGMESIYDPPIGSNTPYHSAQGYFTWANASLGGRLTLIRNAGVAGETTAQMLARVTDVTTLPVPVGYCIVLAGTNDVWLYGQTSTQVTTNLQAIYDAIHAAGITVVACTIPPIAGVSTSIRQALNETNNWIRDRSQQPGFIVCDWAARWTDPASGARTGYSSDGVHPKCLGAGALGIALADALRPYIGGSVFMPSTNDDYTNKLLNGMMTGTTGSVFGGASGTVATSWAALRVSGAGTLVCAKAARTDEIAGEWQTLTLSGGGGTFNLLQYVDGLAGLAAGQRWILEMEYDSLTPTDIKQFDLRMGFSNVGGGGFALGAATGLNEVYPSFVPAGVIRTPPITVPASASGIRVFIDLTGTAGSVRVSRARLRRWS